MLLETVRLLHYLPRLAYAHATRSRARIENTGLNMLTMVDSRTIFSIFNIDLVEILNAISPVHQVVMIDALEST
jgi:hypothetical protein